MKNSCKLFILLLWLLGFSASVLADAQETLYPQPSTERSENWYYMKFKKHGFAVQNMGKETLFRTRAMEKDVSAQMWKFIGTRDAGSYIQSQTGNYIYFAAQENRYKTTADKTKATLLYVAPSLNPQEPYKTALELTRNASSDVRFNQMQSGGVNKTINDYPAGETNPLEFISSENADFPLKHPEEVPYTSLNQAPASQHVLWYKDPSKNWMTSSLPIGNGELGAMIFGGILQDEVQFNEKTLWSGQPPVNGVLSEQTRGAYQNFGSLFINADGVTAASNYQRELDLENAVATVRYTSNGVNFRREYISSNPDGVIAIHYTADKAKSISLNVYQEDAHGAKAVYENGAITVSGKLQTVSYNSRVRLVAKGAEVTGSPAKGLEVRNADEVLLLLKAGTDYDPLSPTYTANTSGFAQDIDNRLDQVARKSWKEIYGAHVADYRSFYNRVKLQLTEEPNTLPTPELIKKYNEEVNAGAVPSLLLEQMLYHYGRYLLISSSRGITLPANLQGIWNNDNTPPWCSDIHANINVQMNYWPAEPNNLSDLHDSFLTYLYNEAIIQPQWRINAYNSKKRLVEKIYGAAEAAKVTPVNARGWTLYTSNDIFGGGGTFMQNNVSANAWNCMHLWQHYRYTLDVDFLLKKAYPVMKSACEFWIDRLIEDRGASKGSNPHIMKDFAPDGTLVAPLEYSPENGPEQEDGVAHAQQLCWDLFNNTLQAMNVLGDKVAADGKFKEELQKTFSRLDSGVHIDEDGHLREWKYSERAAGQHQHRHNSHLMGLYPGNQISPSVNKEIFDAAVKSLTARGDGGTGWSIGWKINLWARALDGEHAHKAINSILHLIGNRGGVGGGVYENLLDAHPPFQIDGNFGATAGIAEMLLQSHMGTLHLLPAIPAAWQKGKVEGLCAAGGFLVGLCWSGQRLQTAQIFAKQGGKCSVQYDCCKEVKVTEGGKTVNATVKGAVVTFTAEKGKQYTLTFTPSLPKNR